MLLKELPVDRKCVCVWGGYLSPRCMDSRDQSSDDEQPEHLVNMVMTTPLHHHGHLVRQKVVLSLCVSAPLLPS